MEIQEIARENSCKLLMEVVNVRELKDRTSYCVVHESCPEADDPPLLGL